MPAEFRPEEQLQRAFGIVEEAAISVRVKFSPAIAHTVKERLWHPSQQIREEEDGSVLLSFEAGGRMEIISWLLSYGRYAEVLEPSDLREEMRGIVAEMAGMYR